MLPGLLTALGAATATLAAEWSLVSDPLASPAPFWEVLRSSSGRCELLQTGERLNRALLDRSSVYLEHIPEERAPHGAPVASADPQEVLRFSSHDQLALRAAVRAQCPVMTTFTAPQQDFVQLRMGLETLAPVEAPPLIVTPILTSGNSKNRVSLVFFSDGYTEREQEKFITDATKLAYDIAGNTTFATVQPLLNIFAAFSPSVQSGIGMGGKQKDTVFGLYRDGTELRGVYTGKKKVARAACQSVALTVGCDYPILLGNDPRYGGLGGPFTIVTASKLNGPLVLRHELGHSIIEIGEEYDGGFVYDGVNAEHSLPAQDTDPSTFKWNHWLGSPPVRAERAVMPLMDYAWAMLNHSTAWKKTFTSAGTYDSHVVVFSLSGIPRQSHLRVSLDGSDLGWAPRKAIGQDRWHYRLQNSTALSEGEHEVKFELLEPGVEGDVTTGQGAQLCSVEVIEFGDKNEFNKTPGHISAYPTFSIDNQTSYRPTNEGCLMRLVTTETFCSVCIEGLWLSLLRKVHLIEYVSVAMTSCQSPLTMDVSLVALAQHRTDSQTHLATKNKEAYIVTWTRDYAPLDAFENSTHIEIPPREASGLYQVSVEFITDEVRRDPKGLLKSSRVILVDAHC